MATPTLEVKNLAKCIQELASANKKKSEADIRVKEFHLKLTEIRKAEEKAKNDAMDAEQNLSYAIENVDESIELTTLEKTLMSMLYNENKTEAIFSEAKEKEKKASEEYKTAIRISEVANEKYLDAVNKMKLARKPAKDSVPVYIS